MRIESDVGVAECWWRLLPFSRPCSVVGVNKNFGYSLIMWASITFLTLELVSPRPLET